ncbi:MAG: response regulator transcription factor, partial [Betaproteobacteria bacterium]
MHCLATHGWCLSQNQESHERTTLGSERAALRHTDAGIGAMNALETFRKTDNANTAESERCILIVEDNLKTSELLSIYLRREGFHTIAAFGGHDALALAARHRPLLVILDVMLPDFDGWEICTRLRQSISGSIPILMISALGEAHDRIKGLTLGADDYVVKPFSFIELVARVHAILRRVRVEPRPARVPEQLL